MLSSRKPQDTRFSLTRRVFLKTSAFIVAALALSRLIKLPKTSALTPTEGNTEGVITEEWLATSCLNCPSRCATRVRVVNGRAVKISGNPLSQVSEGEICPRGHIGLQVLYDPDRITSPLKRTNPAKGRGIDPRWTPISWDEAISEISIRLRTLRHEAQPERLLLLNGLNTKSDEDIVHRFAAAYGTPNIISGDSLENVATKRGRWLADGNYSHIAYDLGNTNYILAFGASIVESERPLARNLRMWGKIRREKPNRAKVVAIDPHYSTTAAKADHWLPINPGTDAALAMAIAGIIISEGLYDSNFVSDQTSGFDEYKELVQSQYSPEEVATITGVDAATIRQLAREFARTKPAIAWAGRNAAAWPNGTYTSYAIFCLNALVGSINVPGGIIYQQDPEYQIMPAVIEDSIAREGRNQPRLDLSQTSLFPSAEPATNQVADSILQNNPYPVEIAIGFNSNFNMTAPGSGRWDEALARIPYYLHLAPFVSEMAGYADIILPPPTYLEQWGYDHSPPGSGFAELKLKQPVVEPLHDTKSITDTIFALAEELGGTVARSFNGIGDDARGFVKYRTETIIPWSEFRERGVWVGPDYQYHNYQSIFKTPSGKFEFRSGNLENILGETSD